MIDPSPPNPERLGTLEARARPATDIFFGRGSVTTSNGLARLLDLDRSSHHVLISDETVFALHGRAMVTRLHRAGFRLSRHVVPASEHSKSTDRLIELIDRILRHGIDKHSSVLTLGGGMVNNLGGLVASLLHRGVALIHLPSSLLAQLDAAIDDKQAVNHGTGKNLVGAIYSPRRVVIDPDLLLTLPPRQLRNGAAEAIKHALTQSAADVQLLQQDAERLLDPSIHERLVRRTVDLKLSLMGNATESRGEALLQYGHCLGHALERVTDFRLLHGEAIAIGMTLSAEIAHHLGLCAPGVVDTHYRIFGDYGLPVSLPAGVPIDHVLTAAQRDKYCRNGRLRMALLRDLGEPIRTDDSYFVDVDPADVRAALDKAATRRSSLAF